MFLFLIATARCEKIELFNSLNSDRDLEIKAKVVWVGTSSLEVLVTIDSHKLGTESRREISGRFIMVARDKDNKAIAINKLLLNSEEDKQNFFEAQKRADMRKSERSRSLTIAPPTPKELEFVHNLYLETSLEKSKNPAQFSLKYKTINETRWQSTLVVF